VSSARDQINVNLMPLSLCLPEYNGFDLLNTRMPTSISRFSNAKTCSVPPKTSFAGKGLGLLEQVIRNLLFAGECLERIDRRLPLVGQLLPDRLDERVFVRNLLPTGERAWSESIVDCRSSASCCRIASTSASLLANCWSSKALRSNAFATRSFDSKFESRDVTHSRSTRKTAAGRVLLAP